MQAAEPASPALFEFECAASPRRDGVSSLRAQRPLLAVAVRMPNPTRRRLPRATTLAPSPARARSHARLLVATEDRLDVALGAEDYGAAVVDAGGDEVEHALHAAVEHAGRGDAARRLHDEGHREALVQHAQLASRALLVGGVYEDAAVEDGAMHVGDHRSDVARGVLVALEPLDRVLDRLVPAEVVALVARVDLLPSVLGELHICMRVDELAKRRVQREAINTSTTEAKYELGRGTVHTVASNNDVIARAQNVVDDTRSGALLLLVDGEDGASAHVTVDVGGAVERVERNAEAAHLVLGDYDRVLVLLGDEHGARTRVDERRNEDVVREHVQLLLVVTRRVLLTSHTKEAGNASLGTRA
mmetsp:Transcript_36611/g.78109  ORF Transcript_36611/g.78109 Transcript_36611/m.78109 type:complete len:360 (+) Transcript_36611:284-1363(+)